jgi:hypothetical protein
MRTGFHMPPGSASSIYIQTIAGLLLGFALLYYLPSHSQHLFIIVGLASTIGIGAAWYHAQRNWVYLSEEGIEGASRRGDKACITWGESISLKKGSDCGVKCVVLTTAKKDKVIMLPLPIANSKEFKTALRQVAPPGHPLNHLVENAL